MTFEARASDFSRLISRERLVILLLIWSFLIATCASLILVSDATSAKFHILFYEKNAVDALLLVLVFGMAASALFAISRFSFGYFVSFYFLSLTTTYLWLSYFTPLKYDHQLARASAVISFLAFFLPAMTITARAFRLRELSARHIDLVSTALLVIVAAVVIYAARFGFVLSLTSNDLQFNHPSWLNYLISISASTLVPFAFAWFYQRRLHTMMLASFIAGLFLYPVSLNKTTAFAPFWLLTLSILLKLAKARVAVILSLLAPMLIGVLAFGMEPAGDKPIFGLINFRMLAIPGSALDHYYHYFSTNSPTHFCQISLIGKLFQCSPPDQLGVVMEKVYGIGNYNASLFATEGIASVGVWLAPLSALLCGLIVAVGNISSSGLPASFVVLSGSILTFLLMNVPLSVVMVTHGGLLMFLLWLVSPRTEIPSVPVNESERKSKVERGADRD